MASESNSMYTSNDNSNSNNNNNNNDKHNDDDNDTNSNSRTIKNFHIQARLHPRLPHGGGKSHSGAHHSHGSAAKNGGLVSQENWIYYDLLWFTVIYHHLITVIYYDFPQCTIIYCDLPWFTMFDWFNTE